ncbi:MAG TPA: glutamyl-tRNA reductase [Actinomycetota bacterium]
MSILVVGLNYKGAPLDLLERITFDQSELPKALAAARASEHVREAVILSTCNRIEVYAAVDGFHGGLAALKTFLSEFHHVPLADFGDRAYGLYEEEAVRHLFSVASGIESMVIGEPQILTQVRRAFRGADSEGAVGWLLSALFRHAIRAGRRARSETGIAGSSAGFAEAGATLARRALGSFQDRTVLVLGAGKMSDLAAASIAAEGARVLIANRTHARATALAERLGGEAVPIGDPIPAIERADLILASTGSPQPMITREQVEHAMARRPERKLLVLDLAVPRDVEPAASAVPNVEVRDLDSLRDELEPGIAVMSEIDAVRAIVDQEVPRFSAWKRGHAFAPLIGAMKDRGETIRAAELARARALLERLDESSREAVEALTHAIVAKLLHDPVASLKDRAGTAEGEAIARALRVLWSLDDGEEEF